MTEPTSDYGMPVHPVCDLFPLMSGSDLEVLKGDILNHGLVNPIVVHDGQIVDGRNRLLACRQASVKPSYVQWRAIYHDSETVAQWIWSTNAERRHLTVDQWLAVQVAFQAWEERELAKLKQIEGGKTAGRGRPQQLEMSSSQPIHKTSRSPQVRRKLAKRLGVSEHKVQQALNVQKADPDLLKQVTNGTVKLSAAAKRVKETTPTKRQAPAALMPADLRPILRPVLEAADIALHSVVSDDQRLALVKVAQRGKPTMETWRKYFEKDKTGQRKALLTALGNWVEELDPEDATITPDGPGEERAESAEGGIIMQPNQDEPFGLRVGEPADEEPDGDFDEEPYEDEDFEDGDLEEPEVAVDEEDGPENGEGETR